MTKAVASGGPWTCDDSDVACDGFLESWGFQEGTVGSGPTVDGLEWPIYRQNPRSGGPGGGGLRENQDIQALRKGPR